jgi:hypothetical protein
MPRTLSLLIFSSPLFPVHRSLWILSTSTPHIGKRLHATGSEIAFERNYNIDTETRRYQILSLGEVLDDAFVMDVKGDGSESTDQVASDYLEDVVRGVEAPGGVWWRVRKRCVVVILMYLVLTFGYEM